MFKKLKELNPSLPLYCLEDKAFLKYGKQLKNYDITEYLTIMEQRSVPAEGNVYIGNDPDLSACKETDRISALSYGGMPIQAGYCNGCNNRLNALEYHKGNEITIAVTDLVLLLGDVRDIHANTYASELIEAFYMPRGNVCELYGTTLHFAPCKVDDSGFKSIIILPAETNTPITLPISPAGEEDQLLWMRNKWLIAHADSKPAANGAYVGIHGENIELRYPNLKETNL